MPNMCASQAYHAVAAREPRSIHAPDDEVDDTMFGTQPFTVMASMAYLTPRSEVK